MLLKSFSKINLSLSVNKKSKMNGLYEIQSYFCLINLFDQIKIKKIKGKKDVVQFKGKFAKNVKKKNNSIIDTLQFLRKRKLISNFYSVLIKKKIPVFSGMGGGTSNAVCILKYLAKKKINENILNILEKKIGSDLRLFFYKQGFVKNLKTIKSLPSKYKLNFLLVYPNIQCSTRYVYSKVNSHLLQSKNKFSKINDKRRFIDFIKKKQNNTLQLIVENQHPTIKKLTKEIEQKKGCYFSRMSGSGSVCYGVFESEKTAKAALKVIKLKHPKYWSHVAKTI